MIETTVRLCERFITRMKKCKTIPILFENLNQFTSLKWYEKSKMYKNIRKMKVFNFLSVIIAKAYQISQMQAKCVVSKNEFDSVPVPYRQ